MTFISIYSEAFFSFMAKFEMAKTIHLQICMNIVLQFGNGFPLAFARRSSSNKIQRVLALCYFWDLEKFALAKNRISKIFILCMQ